MSENTLYIAGIALYLGLMVYIGYLVRNKIKTSEDYLVAGRSFGLFLNTATLVGCFLGGGIIIAVPGLIFSVGIWDPDLSGGALILIGGFIMCLLMAGAFYLPKLWRMKLLSLGDFFYMRYGQRTGLVSSILISCTFLFWVGVQILVFGKILEALLGWNLEFSVLMAMTVICLYTMLGGLYAVCYTDILHTVVTVAGVVALMAACLVAVGGWDVFTASYNPDLVHIAPRVMEFDPWVCRFIHCRGW
jgi:SSS family solute:Na+ symporter